MLATKGDLHNLQDEMKNLHISTLKWVAIMLVGQGVAIVALQNLIA